jgi:tetratricopeptide (TPR) repeat protein
MQTHIRAAVTAGVATLALWPLSSTASTFIIGNGFAHDCSVRAIFGLKDAETITVCSNAIDQEFLSDGDFAKTLVNRGVVLTRRASLDDASKDLDRAQKVAPDLAEIYINRAVILIKRKQFADAVTQLDRGLALGSDEPEKVYYDRGVAKEGIGDIKGAYLDYKKANELKPTWDLPPKELARFNVAPAPT